MKGGTGRIEANITFDYQRWSGLATTVARTKLRVEPRKGGRLIEARKERPEGRILMNPKMGTIREVIAVI